MPRRALFAVSDLGRGHEVRCGALADELQARGWDQTTLAGWYDVPGLKDYDVIIADGPFSGDDGEAYVEACKDVLPNVKVVIVADVSGNYPADLLVAGGAGATPEMYKDSGAKRILAGPQYALLRREILDWRVQADRILRRTGPALDIRSIEGIAVNQLGAMLAHATAVITYGGMRSLEAACVGAPMVVLSRNDGETDNMFALMAAGAGVIATEGCEETAVKMLFDCYDPRKMSSAGKALVDGLGCQRVADAIEELCK